MSGFATEPRRHRDSVAVNAKLSRFDEQHRGSGFIAPDNKDGTAATFHRLLQESGLPREETINWNVVSWCQPDGGTRTANATPAIVEEPGRGERGSSSYCLSWIS